jgi:hypothetical protein
MYGLCPICSEEGVFDDHSEHGNYDIFYCHTCDGWFNSERSQVAQKKETNQMLEKLIFDVTPSNTIRVFAYFPKEEEEWKCMDWFAANSLSHFFEFTSVWGAWDKQDDHMISFELPITLKEFIKKKFENFWCETEIRLG